jgi:RNA polymerase-binding transcription factor DksA
MIEGMDSARYEARLRARRSELVDEIRASRLELDEVLEARADGLADDEHDPEGSTLSSDWSRITGLGGALAERLAETDDALRRLDAGTYGRCARCGRDIDVGRLDARPMAELCIDCARDVEA